jgi:hypothetical protein
MKKHTVEEEIRKWFQSVNRRRVNSGAPLLLQTLIRAMASPFDSSRISRLDHFQILTALRLNEDWLYSMMGSNGDETCSFNHEENNSMLERILETEIANDFIP